MARRYTSKKDFEALKLKQNGKCACGVALIKGNTIIEHSTPLALSGMDVIENKYLNCTDCAAKKTYGGKARATTLGSDIHAIAKVRRIRGELKPKMKRQWPQGKKIPKRPFAKRPKRNTLHDK